MAKLCPKGKAAAKRKFKVYPSAYANMYASGVCSGKIKPGGRKKAMGGGRIGYKSGSEDFKLGTKFQGNYKNKSLPGKVKEFVKTAGKQTVGTAKDISEKLRNKNKKMGGGMIDMTRMKYLKGGRV